MLPAENLEDMMQGRQQAHLEFKHGKVVANAHAAARAKRDEGARPVTLLTQPSAYTTAYSGDAVQYDTGLVQDLLSSCRRSISQHLADGQRLEAHKGQLFQESSLCLTHPNNGPMPTWWLQGYLCVLMPDPSSKAPAIARDGV